MTISIHNQNFWGYYTTDNTDKEEMTHHFIENQMPVALFLLLASGLKEATARYFSLMTYTEEARQWAQKFNEKTNLQIVSELVRAFEKDTNEFEDDFESHFDHNEEENDQKMQDSMYNQPRDIILPLHLYAKQFARHFTQKTFSFDALSQGIVMTCPLSYIGYWNREEFNQVDKAIDHALEMIMQDVIRIMKIKGMAVNEYSMTIEANGFKALKFITSYGW